MLWLNLLVFSPGLQDRCQGFRCHILTFCLKVPKSACIIVSWNPFHLNFCLCPTGQSYVTCPPLNKSQAKMNYLLWLLGSIMIRPLAQGRGHLPWTRRKKNNCGVITCLGQVHNIVGQSFISYRPVIMMTLWSNFLYTIICFGNAFYQVSLLGHTKARSWSVKLLTLFKYLKY